MDVQAASSVATIPPVAYPSANVAAGNSASPVPLVAAPVVSAPAPSGGSSSNTGQDLGPAVGATPGLAILPAGATDQDKAARAIADQAAAGDKTLSSSVAKLFNTQEQNVQVSFRIESDPNEIVTVFTDKQTGKTIVQFPSETLVALAQFFNKLGGGLLDKKV